MPVYDVRYDVFWPDWLALEFPPPWEIYIPECVARPDKGWLEDDGSI